MLQNFDCQDLNSKIQAEINKGKYLGGPFYVKSTVRGICKKYRYKIQCWCKLFRALEQLAESNFASGI